MSQVLVGTADIVSQVQSFLKNSSEKQNKTKPKSRVMKILEYRWPVQSRRVKHDLEMKQQNEAALLCRWF